MFQRVTVNLGKVAWRYETHNGRKHMVLPTVMLTEGVHTGSNGPLLYLKEEFGKNAFAWNARPAVINHPQLSSGEGISACQPDVIEKQSVGLLFNSSSDAKLKTETWVDEEKLKKLSPDVHQKIVNGEPVEVSTGLFHDLENTSGVHNGESYVGIVRNIQPDHLAILPDQVGACSIKAGGGLLRNAGMELSHHDIKSHLHSELKQTLKQFDYAYITDVFPKYVVYEKDGGKLYRHDYKVKDGKAQFSGDPQEVLRQTSYVTANGEYLGGMAYNVGDMALRLQKEIATRYAQTWVCDLYDGNVIVTNHENKLFRLSYDYVDDKITLGGPPEEVERASEYRSKPKGKNMGTQNTAQTVPQLIQSVTEPPVMDPNPKPAKASMIQKLLTDGGWTEQDKPWLESCTDDGLQRLIGRVKPPVAAPAVTVPAPVASNPTPPPGPVPSQNQAQTVEGYLQQLPGPVQQFVRNALDAQQKRMDGMITAILSRNTGLNKDWLAYKAQNEPHVIEAMYQLACGTAPTVNYGGQAEPPMFLANQQGGMPYQQYGQPSVNVEGLPILKIQETFTANKSA